MSTKKTSGLKEIQGALLKAKINPKDIDEQFIRSRGKGGQYVNKVATCVCLYHRSSGIRIKCQEFRTQLANRISAYQKLLIEVQARRKREQQKEKSLLQKIKRQNRPRTRKTKERMKQDKKNRSQIKSQRRRILQQTHQEL